MITLEGMGPLWLENAEFWTARFGSPPKACRKNNVMNHKHNEHIEKEKRIGNEKVKIGNEEVQTLLNE